jgi:hypothetical protein
MQAGSELTIDPPGVPHFFFLAHNVHISNLEMNIEVMILGKNLVTVVAYSSVYKTEITAVEIHHADHVAPSICKGWHWFRRQAAVARLV